MVAGSYSPVHEASLIDPSLHSPALLELLEVKLSRSLIEYVVDCVAETVDFAMGRPSTSSRGRPQSRQSDHSNFTNFVTNVLHKAEVKVPVLLVTLVYIDRAKPHLQIALEQWACERVFLGALVAANKYCNDSTLKNVHWALCTGVFGKRDVGRIEREFLDVLDYELSIHESDLLSHHDAVISLSHPSHHVRHHSRAHAAVSAPASPHHHHHHHKSLVKTTPPSRWSSSSESGDSDADSVSSTPLQTPEMEVDPSFVQPALAKHTPEESYHSSHPIVLSPAHVTHSKPSTTDIHASHPRIYSSALQILRSFPMPHFHSGSSTSSTPSPPGSSTTSSSASSASSIPRSKSMAHHHLMPPTRPAQVYL